MILLFTGCASVTVPEAPRELGSLDPQEAWKSVLAQFVDAQGRVDFKGVAADPARLKLYVNWVSRVSPQNHPELFHTDDERLAYYLNSYNALSMYNVIDYGIPTSLSGLKKVQFFFLRKLTIGGESMSLYAYENDIIRKQGEERVHFALNCMSGGCPRLPRTPFFAKGLRAELEKQAFIFFNEARNVEVDASAKQVKISQILEFYTEDFLKKKPTLAAYINQYRKEKVPEDFEVEFIPYDWRINAQPQVEPAKVSGLR